MSITAPTSPVLTVLNLTTSTPSNADGYKLLLTLKAALAEQAGPVTLDLAGVVCLQRDYRWQVQAVYQAGTSTATAACAAE